MTTTNLNRKLTHKEVTKAVANYARRRGMYRDLVRTCSTLLVTAVREYRTKIGLNN